MPLITCPDCNKQISDRAPTCPNCGAPHRHLPMGAVPQTNTTPPFTETCSIDVMQVSKSFGILEPVYTYCFYARAIGRNGQYNAGTGEKFKQKGRSAYTNGGPSHKKLIAQLVRDGWKPVGRGLGWYEDRFQRSLESSAPPLLPSGQNPKAKTSSFKGCLGCLGVVAILIFVLIVAGLVRESGLKKEFAANRDQILKQVKAAADAGDNAHVVELADKYEIVHDPELDRYLVAAHATLKAADEKKRAAEAAAEEKKRAAEEKERATQAKADAIKQEAQAKIEAKERAARNAKEDAADGPWVPRVRALTIRNAEAAGQQDGFNVVTQYVVKFAYSGGNNYEMQSGLQDFKNTALAGYDMLAAKHDFDTNVYNAYRRGWVSGFDANARTATLTTH